MGDDILLNLLGNIAFPSAVALYTLTEVNKNLKRLTEAITRLTQDLDKRLDRVEHDLYELQVKSGKVVA